MNSETPTQAPRSTRSQDTRRWWLAGVVMLVFVVSLFLPVFYRSDGTHVAPGWAALVYGWMAVHPAWLANPLWLAGLILLGCKRYLVAAILATLGVLLALSTFSLVGAKMWTGDLTVLAISAGYYAWLASQLILAGGAFVLWRSVGRHHRQA